MCLLALALVWVRALRRSESQVSIRSRPIQAVQQAVLSRSILEVSCKSIKPWDLYTDRPSFAIVSRLQLGTLFCLVPIVLASERRVRDAEADCPCIVGMLLVVLVGQVGWPEVFLYDHISWFGPASTPLWLGLAQVGYVTNMTRQTWLTAQYLDRDPPCLVCPNHLPGLMLINHIAHRRPCSSRPGSWLA
jgi:hypothetical protein